MDRSGAIVVDKPSGWTSHDVVNKLRRLAGTKRIGHLGTLDPLATGVLPLLLNRATRLAQFFAANDKRYDGVVRFGLATDTYDADGEPTSEATEPNLTRDEIESALGAFRGTFDQVPPPVSAKKVGGVPAYKLARRKETFELQASLVTIHALDLTHFDGLEAAISVHCTAGTYVRSIAHEIGMRLGCGAHLKSLRRTASGTFNLSHAKTLESLAELASEDRFAEALVPSAQLLPEIPAEIVDPIAEAQIRHGREFRVSPFRLRDRVRFVKAVSRSGDLIAIGEARLPSVYHPIVVL